MDGRDARASSDASGLTTVPSQAIDRKPNANTIRKGEESG